MSFQKQFYYPAQEIGTGVWMPKDEIDYKSEETSALLTDAEGKPLYRLKDEVEKYYYYNADGVLETKKTIHVSNKSERIYHYEYNPDGFLLKQEHISCWHGREHNFMQRHFTKIKNGTLMLVYYEGDRFFYLEKRQEGTLHTEIMSRANHSGCYHRERTIEDGLLRKVHEINLNSNQWSHTIEYVYNAHRLCSDEIRTAPKQPPLHTIIEYDNQLQCISREVWQLHEQILVESVRYDIEYDEQNRWIRKVKYKNEIPEGFISNEVLNWIQHPEISYKRT
jgi:hypothetical protein